MRQIVIALLTSLFLFVALPIAAGGGSWMSPTDDYIRPGDEVSLVGYVYAPLDDVDREWVATLFGPQNSHSEGPEVAVLGPVSIELTRLGGYLSYRVSINFICPDGLQLGDYTVLLSSEGEGDGYLGDMIGAWFSVGRPSENSLWVEWALDDPMIADLPDDAVIAGPGFDITAAELRAGIYPAGAADYLMDPSILGQRGVVVKAAPILEPAPTISLGVADETVEVTAASVKSRQPAQNVEVTTLPEASDYNWWPVGVIGAVVLTASAVALVRLRVSSDTELL